MMPFLPIFIIICLWKTVNSVPKITYEEIEELGASCESYLSCSDDNSPLNCECDADCVIYDNCCFDSPYLDKRKSNNEEFDCIDEIYIKTTCPIDWNNDDIKKLCQFYQDSTDPLSIAHVTSLDSMISYRNYYCAVCNNDQQNIRLWDMYVECNSPVKISSNDKELKRDLYFHTEYQQWGITSLNETGHKIFVPCSINSVPKIDGYSNVTFKRCIKDTISKCPINWFDTEIKEKCESYEGIVYIRSKVYKNIHCALCNDDDLNYVLCFQLRIKPVDDSLDLPGLFRFNIVGSDDEGCSKQEFYDPVFKVCRELTCGLPILKMKDGKCVRKNET